MNTQSSPILNAICIKALTDAKTELAYCDKHFMPESPFFSNLHECIRLAVMNSLAMSITHADLLLRKLYAGEPNLLSNLLNHQSFPESIRLTYNLNRSTAISLGYQQVKRTWLYKPDLA